MPKKAEDRVSPRLDNLLVMYYSSKDSIAAPDLFSLMSELHDNNRNGKLNLLLNSGGGNIYAAYKAVNFIRSRCKELRVFVPLYAKSAATLMTLGADQIVMGEQSELGPLDAPMEHPILEGIPMSALDGVNPLDFLLDFCHSTVFTLGGHIRQEVELSRKDSVALALDFASKYIEPVVSKLDPLVINMCYRHLQISQRYAKELLLSYMFKNKKNKESLADEVSYSLVWEYPEHSFAISCAEAKRLGLNVIHADDVKDWDALWKLYMVLEQADEKKIHFCKKAECAKLVKEYGGKKP